MSKTLDVTPIDVFRVIMKWMEEVGDVRTCEVMFDHDLDELVVRDPSNEMCLDIKAAMMALIGPLSRQLFPDQYALGYFTFHLVFARRENGNNAPAVGCYSPVTRTSVWDAVSDDVLAACTFTSDDFVRMWRRPDAVEAAGYRIMQASDLEIFAPAIVFDELSAKHSSFVCWHPSDLDLTEVYIADTSQKARALFSQAKANEGPMPFADWIIDEARWFRDEASTCEVVS